MRRDVTSWLFEFSSFFCRVVGVDVGILVGRLV
jgi:hypothetical protein